LNIAIGKKEQKIEDIEFEDIEKFGQVNAQMHK
jgi:hypothetical protein